MKNRILSFVLAVVMVLAMVPVAAIGASAESGMGIEFSLSNYTVTPGGTAYVDLYASVDDMLGYDGICNFQVYFTLPEGVSICQDGHTYYNVGVKPVAGTVNVGDAMICGSAYGDLGEYIATAEQLTAKGGALLATVAFSVPAAAEGTVYDITVASVSDFNLRKTEGETQTDAKTADADLAAAVKGTGKVTIGTATVGEATTTDGVVYFPASISAFAAADAGKYNGNSYVVKNTAPSDVSMFLIKQYTTPGFTVYCHKRANGVDTAATQIAATGATVKNILSAGAIVDGETVTFYGNLVIEDAQYEDVCVEAKFTYVDGEETVTRTFTSKATTKVYTTLTNGGKDAVVVSTSESVATAAGAEHADGAYLFGAVVNGVKAAEYTLEVVAYGRTWDANGNLIYVCSDVYSQVVGG